MKKHRILTLALAFTLIVMRVFSLGTLKADEKRTCDQNIYYSVHSECILFDSLEDLTNDFFGYGYYDEYDLESLIDDNYGEIYYPESVEDVDLGFEDYDFDEFNDFYDGNDVDNQKVVELDGESEERIDALKVLLSKLIPEDRLKRIQNIKEFTDGKDGVLAYVDMADRSGERWNLSCDPADVDLSNEKGDKRDILRTLIHEYAHIESLNDTQINHGVYKSESGNIVLEEGTAKEKSYINQFAKKFWTKKMMEEVKNDDDGEKAYNMYLKNPNNFVSDYAASNVVEDFAESFAAFVLRDKVTDDSIASRKVKFFYGYPDLVELRNHMRKAINDIK